MLRGGQQMQQRTGNCSPARDERDLAFALALPPLPAITSCRACEKRRRATKVQKSQVTIGENDSGASYIDTHGQENRTSPPFKFEKGAQSAASPILHVLRVGARAKRAGRTKGCLCCPPLHIRAPPLRFANITLCEIAPSSRSCAFVATQPRSSCRRSRLPKVPRRPPNRRRSRRSRASAAISAASPSRRTSTRCISVFSSTLHSITSRLQVLKQVHPDTGVSSKAMSIMNSFVNDIFERIAGEASR